MKPIVMSSLRSSAVMVAFAVVFTGMMAVVHAVTAARVRANEEAVRRELIAQVLPAGSYDNDLLKSARPLRAPELGSGERHAYLATRAGRTTGMVLEVAAPDGYSGTIDLLVGVLADGRISGVRVVQHKETPGLGDYIDIAKSEWIRIFDAKSLRQPTADGWHVKKDGGVFTHMAGATVTPRAVVKAVHRALIHVDTHASEFWGVQP